MDPYSQIPPTPLRISTSAPQSPNYPNRPSPTSFPGPTGIGAPFTDHRLKPLFPDSQRDDLVSKTEGFYGEAEYFGSQMMNRRRIPTHHDPRQPHSRSSDNAQFASPSRHYADVDPREMLGPDPRRIGEYERRQYAEEMQSPSRGPASYYDVRSMESPHQYASRKYYDEPDTYRRDPREESMYARMPQHHQLSNSYDPSSIPYQRTAPGPDSWLGEAVRPGGLRRTPNDVYDNFLPYEEPLHASSNQRRDHSDYDRYLPTTNPRRTPLEYDRDYQERPMRPLTPPMDRASPPPRRRSISRERAYNRSDSDTDDFRGQQQHKTPMREHFFPHHKRRLKDNYIAELDEPSSNSSSSSSEVVHARRSRSNGRRKNSDLPEALPVYDAASSSESSDSDLLPVQGRGRSASRSRDDHRVAAKKSPHHQPSTPKSKSRHNHYVIDLSSNPKRHVTFSPSTENDYNSVDDLTADGSFTAYGKKGENYAQRMADAALLREQSEARHQILQEIRQAMEMRELAADDSDQEFWQKQISTLNASLRKLTVSFEETNSKTPNGTRIRHDDRDDVLSSSRHDTDRSAAAISQSSTIVKVRAPDDLEGGHKFTVRVNGKKLVARVPQGGVFKGDTFSIRLPTEAVEQPSVVKVRAPASLPEGYKFTAKMDDQTIVATVPPGGVKKGEIFTVEVLEYL